MIRRFAKDTIIYALPMFLARAIGLILLPIYTRELGPSDFGFIEFVAAASAILLLILPLEINQAVARLLPESHHPSEQNKIFSSALWFTTAVFSIFGVVVYLSKFHILRLVNLSEAYAQYFGIIPVSFLVAAANNLIQVQFRFTCQAKSSVVINLAVVFFNMLFVVYFFAVGKLSIEKFFWSQIISGLIGVVIGVILASRKYGELIFALDFVVLRKLLKFSLPIVVSSVGVVVSGTVDKIMVGSYVGLTDLGYYGVAAKLSAIVGLGFYVISTALTPIVYREHRNSETKKLIATVFNVASFVSLVFLVIISFLSRSIVELIAGDLFLEASGYLFLLMLSTVFANFYIFFLGMDIEKNTKLLAGLNITSGVFGAFGSFVFVPIFGIWGAVLSTLSSNVVRLVGYIYFSQRLYPVPFNFGWTMLGLILLLSIEFVYKGY